MARDLGKSSTHGRRVLYEGSVGTFGIDDVELPDGRRTELAVLHHPGASAVVPFVGDGEILLLRQFRHAAAGTLWEVPAGKLDPGESPASCAVRELAEETGFSAARLEPLGKIHTTPGFTDEVIHLFAAFDLTPGAASPDPHELLETERMPFETALAMVTRGDITDAKSVCALLLARQRYE